MLTFLGIIDGVITVLLIVAAVAPKAYALQRSITIAKPVAEVFDYIKYLKNQDKFSKWATMDPNMQKTYTGVDGTPGFISAWDSRDKNVGKGEQEILKITHNSQVDFQIRFIKPFAGVAQACMNTVAETENSTTVSWAFESKMAFPMNIMLLFMNMDKMIGKDLETGLENLKRNLEA